MTLLSTSLKDDNLFAAWSKVRDNGGAAGVDGISIGQFGEKLFGRLVTLRSEVEQRQYQPSALLELFIPKKNGKLRRLCIPTVRDRILQTSVAQVLMPYVEPELEVSSFAYRKGRSVKMAVATITQYRDEGYQWVVDADITTFFDQIDHRLLIEKLTRTIPDGSVVPLIELWLAATIQSEHQPPYLLQKGVPQGSPISPLLSNIYLDDLDEALLGENLRLVRFADDFLILCKDQNDAEEALHLTSDVIDSLKLSLNTEKTHITNFDEGFRFLGVDFIRNLVRPADPSTGKWLVPEPKHDRDVDDTAQSSQLVENEDGGRIHPTKHRAEVMDGDMHGVIGNLRRVDLYDADATPCDDEDCALIEENSALEPLVRSLLISGQGLTCHKDNDRIVVSKDHRVMQSIPMNLLDQIMLIGNQMLSTALLRYAAQHKIEVYFADTAGNCQAALDTFRLNHVELHRAQFARDTELDRKLMFGRAFVAGKIQNSRVLLRRYNRRRAIQDVELAQLLMAELAGKLNQTQNLNEVRGLEGQAAHVYFGALRKIIPEEWHFDGRRRRPPTDPFNTLISYGYGVLFKTMLTLLQRRGLNPYLGALHAERPGHPALASDLMEEFRAPVVDAVALHAILDGVLRPSDFVLDDSAELPCRLEDEARKKYLGMLQNKFHSQLIHPTAGQRMDYHRAMQFQVYHYARIMLGDNAVYYPFVMR